MDKRRLVDLGPPFVLAGVAVLEALTGPSVSAPRPFAVAFSLGLTLPLVWRRRAPLVVLAAALVMLLAGDEAFGLADDMGSPFAAVLLAIYASGAHTDRHGARTAAAMLVGFLLVMVTLDSRDVVGDVFFIGGIEFAVFGAARVVRSRQDLADALAARTVELEHEREEKARLAVAEERARIARELHDVVAHNLSVIVVQAGAERREVAGERPETEAVLRTIEDTGRAAMAEMRRLLGMLRRSDDELALAPQPSVDRLGDLVEQVREAGLPVDLRVEGDRRALPPGVDLSAYRIVQEALTNALRHAGPARARVTVRYGREDLEVEVADDGAGAMGVNGDGGGHGLVGMRERVAMFGGDLETGRAAEGGYAVRARLPLAGGV